MEMRPNNKLLEKYRMLTKAGEGTFSEVVKCQSLLDGSLCVSKRMKHHYQSEEQVNNLREVQALRRLNPHPNIIKLVEVVFDPKNKTLDLVCELMEMNMYERIKGRKHHLPESLVQSYMYQLCKSLDHMHRNGIFHRDVKPENILIRDEVLKLADFGSCRGIYSKPPFTEYISTRWYRAPECLLTDGYYSFKMDMWSVGCVFFEVMSLYPLFPGTNELDQITKIHDTMGTPSPQLLAKIRKNSPHMKFNFPHKQGTGLASKLPHASPECIDLLNGLLHYDPELRLSARQALKHPYFKNLRDAEKRAARRLKAAEASPSKPSTAATGKGHSNTHSSPAAAPAAAAAVASAIPSTQRTRGVAGGAPVRSSLPPGKSSMAGKSGAVPRRRRPAADQRQAAVIAQAKPLVPVESVEISGKPVPGSKKALHPSGLPRKTKVRTTKPMSSLPTVFQSAAAVKKGTGASSGRVHLPSIRQ
eukprot:m.88539 g.88539  ORF g.88539 m.88539 type:complete len:473 (-) comp8507_c1_seq1:68-1486(-)